MKMSNRVLLGLMAAIAIVAVCLAIASRVLLRAASTQAPTGTSTETTAISQEIRPARHVRTRLPVDTHTGRS